MITERDSYRDKMEKRLNEMQNNIDGLRHELEKIGQDSREALERQVNVLKERQIAAQQRFESLKRSSADAWEDVKSGMEEAWSDLESSFNDARERVRQNVDTR